MGPYNQDRNESSLPNGPFHEHYTSPIPDIVEILAQDPVRFFVSRNVWVQRGEKRIEILDQYLEDCIKSEKYELCIRIRNVQRLLLRKIWREQNPVKPADGPLKVYFQISRISCREPVREVECDLADEPSMIYKSLVGKKKQEFVRPLVLRPDSPDIPMLVYSSFPFPVEQICITRYTGRVERIGRIAPSSSVGPFIQSFTGHSHVILAPVGFIRKYKINVVMTIVEFMHAIPY